MSKHECPKTISGRHDWLIGVISLPLEEYKGITIKWQTGRRARCLACGMIDDEYRWHGKVKPKDNGTQATDEQN